MAPFVAHRMFNAMGASLVLASALVSEATSAQTAFERASSEGQRQLIERIQEEQAQDGINSPELIAPLSALGLLYQETGDHGAAIAALDRARQIIRVNYGLYTLEEAPLILRMIHSEEARENVGVAWDLEQRLLALARRHPNDPRTVPILRQLGDSRLDILGRYSSGEFPPQIILGCYYRGSVGSDGGAGCRAGSRGRVIATLLREVESYYAQAIDILIRHDGYSNPELFDLLMALVHSSFEYERYGLGRRALRFLLAYEVANYASISDQVNALIEMADWDLLFARGRSARESALAVYEETYDLLTTEGVEQGSIDLAFSPQAPVVIPTFLPSPLVSEKSPDASGFVDVAFDVTRHGAGERVEILGSENASSAAEQRLVEAIERSQFRPMMADGRWQSRSRVLVRYYLTQ